MIRKATASILVLVPMYLGFFTSCGGNSNSTGTPPPTVSIAVKSGSTQNAQVGAPFAAALVATVTTSGTPTSGVSVTFTAPSSGASGTFANGMAKETDTTDASGVATSSTFTANTTSGAYVVTASVAGALTSATFSLTNNAGPAATLTATSGATQNAPVGTAFGTSLAVTVQDSHSNPVSGVAVMFTAPASGASGTFANGTDMETDTTNASGVAASSTFTADATVGGPYVVQATVSGIATPTDFNLTNTAALAVSRYAFYASGWTNLFNPNDYALAGSVEVDASGKVLTGELDYNDAAGYKSPEPSGDPITGGTLAVDAATGQGTLTLVTNNQFFGVSGTATLGVQFVNRSHALVIQFDQTDASSGSMDLQTLPSSPGGGYAFTLTGEDSSAGNFAVGGVFSISGSSLSNGAVDGIYTSTILKGSAISATLSAADSFGRGTITGIALAGQPLSITYYIVGPEVIRMIDVDIGDPAIGLAFGQGTNASAASNAALGKSVFTLVGNPLIGFGALGQFSTSNTSHDPANVSGVGDENNLFSPTVLASPFLGTYSIASNGYGSLTIPAGLAGGGNSDVSELGIYLTDPLLNLNDPNNTKSGLGGALIVSLYPGLTSYAGVVTPQTDTQSGDFAGNYAVGWQNFSNYTFCPCEFDMVAQGSMAAGGVLTLTGLASDPFHMLGTPHTTSKNDTFSGTPLADTSNPGRYSMLSTNATPNPLATVIDGGVHNFDLVIYQASGGQLFWLQPAGSSVSSSSSVVVGPLEQQGSLAGLPAARRHAKTK